MRLSDNDSDRKSDTLKILHCADLHLDSRMTANLDKDKAKERKNELLNTYLRMIAYAEDNGVCAVIIAGDMFDKGVISAHACRTAADAVVSHPDITFFYLKGNHDSTDTFIDAFDEIPENLKLFSDTWKSYRITEQGIRITGVELSDDNSSLVYPSLMLNPEDFNIVVMHGQINPYASKNDAEVIDLGSLRNKNIDYLALGHVHEYQEGALPPRGRYCYPGCLEGRGYDECGDHGFVVLDIDEKTHEFHTDFIPFAFRKLFEIDTDITDCMSTAQISERVYDDIAAAECRDMDMVKVVLTGNVDVDCEKNPALIAKQLSDRFYSAKVSDETKLAVDYMTFAKDESLKGEFVRLIQNDASMTDDEKSETIRCGLQALAGEEIEI